MYFLTFLLKLRAKNLSLIYIKFSIFNEQKVNKFYLFVNRNKINKKLKEIN